MSIRILTGDCRAVLRSLPDESVHCCVTSPPYWGLRNYGVDGQIGLEDHPLEWVQEIVQVFREIRRALRNDGTVWLNLGDKYAGSGCGGASGATTLEGSTDTQDQSKIKRARLSDEKERPWTNGQVTPGFRDKQRLMLPARVALALQDDGWWIRDEIVWAKTNPMPSSVTDRTTPSHEMVYLLTKSQDYFFDATAIAEPSGWDPGNTKAPDGWDTGSGAHGSVHRSGREKGRAVRSGNKERKTGEEGMTRNKRSVWSIATEPFPEAHFATFPTGLVEPCILAGTSERGCCAQCAAPWERVTSQAYYNPGNRATNGPRSVANRHLEHGSTGFEQRLEKKTSTLGWYPTCRCDGDAALPVRPPAKDEKARAAWIATVLPMLKAVSGRLTIAATVLDPFGGAGTTGLVADRLQRHAILIELNAEYVEMARRRFRKDLPLFFTAAE